MSSVPLLSSCNRMTPFCALNPAKPECTGPGNPPRTTHTHRHRHRTKLGHGLGLLANCQCVCVYKCDIEIHSYNNAYNSNSCTRANYAKFLEIGIVLFRARKTRRGSRTEHGLGQPLLVGIRNLFRLDKDPSHRIHRRRYAHSFLTGRARVSG